MVNGHIAYCRMECDVTVLWTTLRRATSRGFSPHKEAVYILILYHLAIILILEKWLVMNPYNPILSLETTMNPYLCHEKCDDMFMQELYYSVLFGNLGVSPNVIGYRLDNYCILMDKLDTTLLEVWRKQGNKLKKCQWQQLLDIQKMIHI